MIVVPVSDPLLLWNFEDGLERHPVWRRRRHLLRGLVEPMRCRGHSRCQALVGEIGRGFCPRREDRRAVLPPHREDERERNKLLLPRLRGECDTQLGNVVNVEVDAIEAVADVDLHELDRSERWVGEQYLAQDAVKGVPKLHSFHGCEGQRFLVDLRERVIHDPSGAPVALRHHAGGRDAKARHMLHCGGGQYNPLPFVDHVSELLCKELVVLVAGLVRPPLQGRVDPSGRPRRRRHFHRRAARLVEFEEPLGIVMHVVECREVAPLSSLLDEVSPPQASQKLGVTLNDRAQLAGVGRCRSDHLRIRDAERRRPRRGQPWSCQLRLLNVSAPRQRSREHPLPGGELRGFGRQVCRPPVRLLLARVNFPRPVVGTRTSTSCSSFGGYLAKLSARIRGATCTCSVLAGGLFTQYIVKIMLSS
mmetsp:Transcript_14752/g.33284  ORF Transcript_14752/g.33284 Transcript_14752/m.33284 type:complete len:420 (+) Transcript_14752:1830-3089(+)